MKKMKRKILCIALFFFAMLFPSICLADDIDMYQSTNVKPNVLIIFDNSGSMADEVPYDDVTPYSGTYVSTTIYQYTCTKSSWHHCTQYEWLVYTGTFTDTDLDGCDDSNPTTIKKGNRLNYDNGTTFVKLAAAKTAVKDVIDTSKNYVRFGIMVLNAAKDINDSHVTFSQYHNDNTVLSSTYGGALIQDRTDAQITTLKSQIDNMTANGGTPLANRLIQAAKYFRGTFPNPSGGTYASPIDQINWCRKNFVIIMTDGLPEGEGNSLTANNNGDYDDIEDNFMDTNAHCRDCDGDGKDPDTENSFIHGGSHYLDDVAYYLFNTSDSLDQSHAVNGNQNLTVYTIGFTVDNPLLEHTASNAGGDYYKASNVDQLTYALNSVMQTIIEQTQIFTAPVVPVQKTTSGDKMYISLFTPQSHDKFWPGYLIKLYIGSDGNLYGSDQTTRATDADDNLLLDSLLSTSGSPQPYWEAHKALKAMNLDSRNIYTYVGGSSHLNDSSNNFVTTNASITSTMLGSPGKQSSGDPSHPGVDGARYDLMRFVRGYDSYDQDGDSVYAEKRQNILGDIIHSKPVIINYGDNVQVVYVGTNDGMLHALDDSNGQEKWAFIPPDLLPKLNNMIVGTSHQYYCDSSPMAYINDANHDGKIKASDGDQVIVIFGEREGGTSYCALDVTDPNDPKYLWRIDNANPTIAGIPYPLTTFGATGVISELGQTWSEPEIGKVKVGTTDTAVAFIGGGYSTDNTKGRGFFIINVLTGALVRHYTIADAGTYSVLGNMTSCIPSTVLAVDTTFDGYINRVYVGGTGSQMWRFANQAGAEDNNVNNWTPRRLFQGNSGAKIFYPPDLVLQPGYAYLYFGTGDRMNPMYISSPNVDRFYAVKDKNETDADFQSRVGGVLTESNLVDVTQDLLQDPGTSETTKNSIRTSLTNGDGWYISMENSGEKVLAPPVVIYGQVIFTSFAPNATVCSSGGDARIYAADYLTAQAVWDLDATNTGLQKDDRSQIIGNGIPTEPVIVIGDDGIARVYVAVGGKIVLMNNSPGNVGFILNSWREVF
jgi:type IV pilus assembly protein PilY1